MPIYIRYKIHLSSLINGKENFTREIFLTKIYDYYYCII